MWLVHCSMRFAYCGVRSIYCERYVDILLILHIALFIASLTPYHPLPMPESLNHQVSNLQEAWRSCSLQLSSAMITYQDRLVVAIVEAASMADSHGLVRNIVADVASGILDAELSLCHDIPGILCRKPHSLDILLDDRLLSLLNRAPQLPVLQATITSHILDYLLEILPDDSRGHLHVRNVLEMLFFGAPLMLVGRMVNDELQWDSIQDIVAALDDSGHPGSRVPLSIVLIILSPYAYTDVRTAGSSRTFFPPVHHPFLPVPSFVTSAKSPARQAFLSPAVVFSSPSIISAANALDAWMVMSGELYTMFTFILCK
ncbi:hypothetical protein OE88DRAFT_930280 [Heliocybe sulcata]|uniref:Uncharacterized protein n=1 Tax=Heliocybe sulcata TaxID=5364 RepID=A0A5C3MQI9_9AGAM|nr:hypothetical protein OE88DRAFT_930280 [Heliocybe sulcata]